MATKDFRASQIETSKIIGAGSISGTTAGIAIYSGSIASNREGGTSDSAMFNNVGSDVFLFVSGTISNSDNTRTDATLFGGDVVISGTLYAERQVIEVDSVADGDFFVTGNFYQEPDSNSTKSVAFRNAAGTDILIVDSTNQRVGIGVSDPDSTLEVFSTSTQLKLSNNTDDFATFAVGTNGDLAITTVDTAGGNANFEVNADGAVDIDANAGSLSLDGSTGINIGTTTDVPIDIDASTLDIDASGAITIDSSVNVSLTANQHFHVDADIALTGSSRFKEQTAPSAGANEAVLYAKDDSGVTKLFMKQSDGTEVGPLGSGGSLNDSYDTPNGGGTKSAGAGAVITVDGQPVQIVRNTPGDIVLGVTGSAIFGETSPEFGNHLPPLPGDDITFFVSGAIGSRGSSTGGTSVFGGDLVVSGNLDVDSNDISLIANSRLRFNNPGENDQFIYGNNSTLYVDGDNYVSLTSDFAINMAASSNSNQMTSVTTEFNTSKADIDFEVNTDDYYATFFIDGNDNTIIMGNEDFTSNPNAVDVKSYGNDVKLYLSGTAGSRGTSTRGVTLATGDLVVSGNLYAGTKHIYNHHINVSDSEKFWSPFRSTITADVSTSINNGNCYFTMVPYSGSLERVTIASRLGSMDNVHIALYRNAELAAHMSASMNGSFTATAAGNIRKATFDFTGGSSLEVTGSNIFDPNDLVSMSIKRAGGANTDCSITTVFRLNDTEEPDEIIIP